MGAEIKCFWPLTSSITSEVKNDHAYVTTQNILNKFIEVNLSMYGLVVMLSNSTQTTMSHIYKIKEMGKTSQTQQDLTFKFSISISWLTFHKILHNHLPISEFVTRHLKSSWLDEFWFFFFADFRELYLSPAASKLCSCGVSNFLTFIIEFLWSMRFHFLDSCFGQEANSWQRA